MFRTLRWRLTFWYGAGAVVLLVLFALIPVTLYATLPSSLRPDPDSTALNAAKNARLILQKTGSPSLVIEATQEPNAWVIVRDKEGNVLASTPGVKDVPRMNPPANSYPNVLDKGDYAATALKVKGSGETIEVYAGDPSSGGPFLRNLVLFEVIGLFVGLVLMVGLGPRLAAAALKPLRRVSEVAGELRRGRLESRVDLPELKSRNDEVGHVAASFDAMAESLEQLVRTERESKESMRRFVADASHELRTPLTSILGYLDVLDESGDRDPDVRHRAYSAMKEEGGRMRNLVEDLLTLARLESQQEILAELVDVAALARDIAGNYPERRIAVAADGPVELAAEPKVLRRVISNLISNAVKYADPAKPIEVSVKRLGGEVILRVSDAGTGIPEKDLPHVFERFYRSETSRSGEGTGLGLAIVKETVETLGGRVEVESVVGEGSTFTVTLPFSEGN